MANIDAQQKQLKGLEKEGLRLSKKRKKAEETRRLLDNLVRNFCDMEIANVEAQLKLIKEMKEALATNGAKARVKPLTSAPRAV